MRLYLRLALMVGAALSVASTDPVKDTRQIMAGTVTTPKIKQEYLDGVRDRTVPFQGALKQVKLLYFPVVVPPPVTWTKCAEEGGTCSIAGTAQVRYGAGSTWFSKTVTGSIGCNTTAFGGDPIFGTLKTCETIGVVVVPTPTPVPVPAPTPAPVTSLGWKAAPLTHGGFAWLKSDGPCCAGRIYRVVGGGNLSREAVPQHLWVVQFFSNADGSLPRTDDYKAEPRFDESDASLMGLAAAP